MNLLIEFWKIVTAGWEDISRSFNRSILKVKLKIVVEFIAFLQICEAYNKKAHNIEFVSQITRTQLPSLMAIREDLEAKLEMI